MTLLVFLPTILVCEVSGEPIPKELTAQPAGPSGLVIDDIGFYYRPDAEVRFLKLRSEWEHNHNESIPLEVLETLAWKAYHQAGTENRLEAWREQGGPNPYVITPRIRLRNNTEKALIKIKVQAVVRAKIGEWLADPDLFLTDYDHLERTARWENLFVEDLTVDVLAPGESTDVTLQPFQLYGFLSHYENRWAAYLETEVWLPRGRTVRGDASTGAKKRSTLQMIPDHFIVPVESRHRLTQ